MNADDDELVDLLRLLRPAPAEWVEAAKRLPYIHEEVDEILSAAGDDPSFRRALSRDPHDALSSRGFCPDGDVVAHLLRRLDARTSEAGQDAAD